MKHAEIDTPTLSVIARAPFHVYFEGQATGVSATNKVGRFDILVGHADFFSVLEPGDITILTAAEPISFMIRNGMMTVRDNNVLLFVNM